MVRFNMRSTLPRDPSRTNSCSGSWIVFAMSAVRISRSRTNHWSVNLSTSGMTAYAMAASVMARGTMNRSDSLMWTPVGRDGDNVTRSGRYDLRGKTPPAGCYNRRLDRGGMLLNAYRVGAGTFALIASAPACAADGPAVLGIPVDFILFGLTLLGVALFHRHTLRVALAGLAVITLYKLAFTGFRTGGGILGLLAHLHHEWVILTNLLCLLLGFALLSRHFEKTHLPAVLPRFLRHEHEYIRIDWIRLGIVFFILITAIVTNVVMNVGFPDSSDRFPFIGASVVIALLLTVPLRRPDWEVLPESFKGSVFLLSLVLSATMMPVEKLPAASWHTALGLGFVSAVFDNIPLTALALKQGGYDWGYLAYGVGFGGSMIWFGSSAGVALSNMYPEV